MRYAIIRRGMAFTPRIIDVQEDQVQLLLKRHPDWEFIEWAGAEKKGDLPAVASEAPKAPKFECPICGKQYKSDLRLKAHKPSHQ